MIQKAITTSDLQSLENKIKLDISEDQRKIRHEANNRLQQDYDKIDKKITNYESDVKVNNIVMERMQKDLTEIKKMIEDLAKAIPNTYVTKEQLDPIKEKQKDHDAIIKRLAWGAFLLLLSLIGWFIWLSKYM